ncbi:MAG: DUF6249 domain-containing protein [Asticcacaulis sp.]|uniref:DUF6249 domain-containing protein n=1 Tax=Asticcacaulis sp. TaxID=1872648 RepID=UPI0039E520A1
MDLEMIVPIVSIVFFFGSITAVVAIVSFTKSRDRTEMQKTVRAAIEKGETLPPEFLESLQKAHPKGKNPANDIRAGLILMAIALGLVALDAFTHGYVIGGLSGVAAIPGFIGVALLILGIVGNRKP